MESVSASSPPPFQKSRVRVVPKNPLQTLESQFTHLLFFLVFSIYIDPTTAVGRNAQQMLYSKHCNDVVPQVPHTVPSKFTLQLPNAIFAGGSEILLNHIDRGAMSLRSLWVYETEKDQIFKMKATLNFLGSIRGTHWRRNLRLVTYRSPRIPIHPDQAPFRLQGFWSSASGNLCMVGSGVSYLSSVIVVLKLNYPNSSNIFTSFVNGTLQNVDVEGAVNYLKPIEILGVSLRTYNYTLIERETQSGGFSAYDTLENVSLGFKTGKEVCSAILFAGRVELDFLDDCHAVNCNFLKESGVVPISMSFNEVECLKNGRMRYLLDFSNSTRNGYRLPFDPNTTLVAEGAWDGDKKRLDLVACQINNVTESLSKGSVGDCSIRLSLRVPNTFSLRNRSVIVGQMWSKKTLNDSSYFGRVAFRSTENKHPRLEALKYEYTETNNVRKSCAKNIKAKSRWRTYPGGFSPDMRFDMTVRNKEGHTAWGYSSPLSVGDQFYKMLPQVVSKQTESVVQEKHVHDSGMNISYALTFKNNPKLRLGGGVLLMDFVEIWAEGIYNAKTGALCMMGCRRLASHYEIQTNYSLDCDIIVNAEFPPLNAKNGGNVKGIIESTRSKADPHYFDRLEFQSNSIYTAQAKKSIWRMDLEITMVLISNTLACIFVGLQLFYVNKNPNGLPFISFMMVIILTLAHMIPLLLNFDAMFFSTHMRQTLFTGTEGWLEVNEVLVRVITMVAFLLEFRLLQVTWSSRAGGESLKNPWTSDKKVLYLSLPLHIGGGLIAWFARPSGLPYRDPVGGFRFSSISYRQVSPLEVLKSYAGLVLDAFLLPQIVFNFFCDSREKALAPTFYIGMTLIRLFPHAYDLYRGHSSTWSFSYIYANPRMDYYSTIWDIFILCSGLLLALIICLQQRFGGRCFLPQRYIEASVYEKVPVN